MEKQTKLTLVGAGPGDPELISIKGVKALKIADVILYDDLVHPELLEYAPKAEKIYVGKRVGRHSSSQDSINSLIVEYALQGKHVVRLKGGDPFIFGRGHEEVTYAGIFNIDTEIIPGISSATAIPALQGIPLTRRNVNESFWVLTGTTRSGRLSSDIKIAAQSSATAVILMGTKKLKEIAAIFSAAGKGDIPVAIVQNGSLDDERTVLATVDTITEAAAKAEISSPAIIVIGEVVALHPEYVEERVKTHFINKEN